jgi:hypothetical protein
MATVREGNTSVLRGDGVLAGLGASHIVLAGCATNQINGSGKWHEARRRNADSRPQHRYDLAQLPGPKKRNGIG